MRTTLTSDIQLNDAAKVNNYCKHVTYKKFDL